MNNKKIIGAIFLLISTILYSTKYITAAIAGANDATWGTKDFTRYLSYTPNALTVFIYLSLLIGVIYFVWGLLDFFKTKK
ncbi:hypothetical protein SAMN05421736_1137 [Evansella caseinilytica]|uniref:Uncharacterized protein n=1 Tax=Evansella caseinilytica TaxID=1503961 RepID=A0A1H3T3A6_9BACI|nr:hypothetical protein [Evansella caseinilytica]SDZ44520.1 hypothetical protein SAMN05421736_1137 [Evansella caseinilytica]